MKGLFQVYCIPATRDGPQLGRAFFQAFLMKCTADERDVDVGFVGSG